MEPRSAQGQGDSQGDLARQGARSGLRRSLLRQALRYAKAIAQVAFRHPILGVVIIPVLADGSLVLVRRVDDGRWSLPGGLVDWGEDITTTATRELQEETGLTLVQMGRLVGVYSDPDRDPRVHSVAIAIEAQVSGQFAVQDTLEISQVAAFAPDQVPLDQLSHDHSRPLQDYFQGATRIA